jgi:Tol biopolymer transport system component
MKFISFSLLLLSACLLLVACQDDNTEPEPTIPLDGRGGGVIAYCQIPFDERLQEIDAINADGTGNIKLITAQIGLNHHNWSPDASRIVCVGYINNASWSIYVFNADGTNLTRLTNTNNVQDSEPKYSPNGLEIAFTRIYPNQNNRYELWIMNSDGSNQRHINIEGYGAKWSPDGTKFIYISNKSGNSEIYTCNVDGTNESRVTTTNDIETNPIWCPDGQYILFARSENEDPFGFEIYKMKLDGTEFTQLTNNTAYDECPKPSPDGSLIAFHSTLQSNNPAPEVNDIYIMNADGTNIRRVTNSPAGMTAVSPDWRPVR